jgi:hypothetical protein
MKKIITCLFFTLTCMVKTYAQHPKNGTYTYQVAFAEWGGSSHGNTVLVKIKGDSIYIIYNSGNLSGVKKGEIMDAGIIMKHTRTGKWIIGHSPADKKAPEIGSCTDGPSVIDFIHKKFWMC